VIFALCTETPRIRTADLYAMAEPLRIYAQHVATAYMDEAPASVVVVDRAAHVPKGAMPIVCVEQGDDVNTIANHYYDRVRDVPAARVFIANTTGNTAGSASVFESICHELAEAKCNAYLAVWADHPNPARRGIQVAYECCDPTQDTYIIEHKGEKWPACNFVTPHWYRSELFGRPAMLVELENDFGYGLDWCKRLRQPGEIGPEGYVVLRRARPDGTYETWSEDNWGKLDAGSKKLANKRDDHARTKRLGGI
jgi:hypothetical protein